MQKRRIKLLELKVAVYKAGFFNMDDAITNMLHQHILEFELRQTNDSLYDLYAKGIITEDTYSQLKE